MKALAFVAAVAMVGAPGAAYVQQVPHFANWDHQPHLNARGEDINGPPYRNRCDGLSYGTGARSCGTATGGPVGGLSSRN